MTSDTISVKHIDDITEDVWSVTETVVIDKYWSGDDAPSERHATVRMLWSDESLFVRFDHAIAEPLVVDPTPDLTQKTIGLWERDVCEIFVAPDETTRNKYFEFEIAPTGEWLDLAIEIKNRERTTDWEYRSRMRATAGIDGDNAAMTMSIPFSSLRQRPREGDVWLGNLFRCVGSGSSRGYLAWRPTFTEVPNFHVPVSFGRFLFTS